MVHRILSRWRVVFLKTIAYDPLVLKDIKQYLTPPAWDLSFFVYLKFLKY